MSPLLLLGSYKQWTRGPEDPRTGDPRTRGPEDPRTEDPRTRGPKDQGPEDIITEGCFALQQLPIAKIQLYSQSRPMLQAQTHGHVLFIVTEGVTLTNNAISNYPLSSLMLRVVYCQSCKAIYLSRLLCM